MARQDFYFRTFSYGKVTIAHFIWTPVDFGVGTLIIQAHMEWGFFYLFLRGALNITIRRA